jgi:hypothetical protein
MAKNAPVTEGDYALAPGQPSPIITPPAPPIERMIPPAPGEISFMDRVSGADPVTDAKPSGDDLARSGANAGPVENPLGSDNNPGMTPYDDQYQTNTSMTPPTVPAGQMPTKYGSPPSSSTRGASRARQSTMR